MIVEWTGCSGSGKTTLCASVTDRLRSNGIDVWSPIEIIFGRQISGYVRSPGIRNALLDLLILPWTLTALCSQRELVIYCDQYLRKTHPDVLTRIRLKRSIYRKLGVDLFLKSGTRAKRMVFVDEGTVHIAHVLFANSQEQQFTMRHMEEFCRLVPTPNFIVHVTAPEDVLIERTLEREHKPIRSKSPDVLIQFIQAGQKIFSMIADLGLWPEKMLKAPNGKSESVDGRIDPDKLAEQIGTLFTRHNS